MDAFMFQLLRPCFNSDANKSDELNLFRLKGGSMITQGNALGVAIQKSMVALKGRSKRMRKLHFLHLFRPFRAMAVGEARAPGRCPGLAYFGLSGRTDGINWSLLGIRFLSR